MDATGVFHWRKFPQCFFFPLRTTLCVCVRKIIRCKKSTSAARVGNRRLSFSVLCLGVCGQLFAVVVPADVFNDP